MFLIIAITVIYGLVMGSFANAVAYRVPTGETLMTRSHCPKCDAKITAWQNIPVLSWLFLRGKCANCKNPISIQYPLIELLTAFLFAMMGYKVQTLNVDVIPAILITIALCYFAFIGVVLSIIDTKIMKLPTALIYPTAIFSAALLSIAAFLLGDWTKIMWMIIGGVGSSVVYFIIWFFFPKGFGFGDVRLVLLTGLITGWFSIGQAILSLGLPFVILSVVMLPLMIVKIVSRKTKIPLGPWIILGSLISIVFGDISIEYYLSVGGLA